uniref:G-protein coupled receptors family 1 profile domain-containing protein n=1 Tax=Pygocentrus nattereri TaxID=42514 RepID=A0AAR2KGK3_PYGNA
STDLESLVTSVYYGYSNNYVDNFLPTEAFSYKTVTKFGSVAVPMFFTIVVLLSLIGNILVLVILGLGKNLKSLTNIFILNLALSDLIFTLGLPFRACFYI